MSNKLVVVGNDEQLIVNARAAAALYCIEFQHKEAPTRKFPIEGLYLNHALLEERYVTDIIKRLYEII